MPKRNKKLQKMFDSVTDQIINEGKSSLLSPITGLRYERPLKDEHPGLDLALMYAQPGNIIAKAFAPSMAKGMVSAIASGDTESLLASAIPTNVVAKSITKPNTTRLYRITGTSGNFTPSPDGTAEFAGQWFTNDPIKPLGYGSETVKKARLAKVNNPLELQVVDIPNSQLERYRASNILKGRTDVTFEPEDFLIPLDTPRGRAPITLTGNRLLDSHISLPQIDIHDIPLIQ